MEELVSVVIPTHKRFEELFRAIDSVLKQTYSNIEIIVVDDNSQDKELRERIKEKIKKYSENIQYIENETNLGGAKSRNVGIEKAKGKYISFLDDDDEYYPEKIEKQYKLYKSKKNQNIRNGILLCKYD